MRSPLPPLPRRALALRLVAPLLAALVLLPAAGCGRRYVITTTTGSRIVTASKPKQVQSKFVYRDASGEKVEISAMRVRLIEPYSKKHAGPQLSVPDLK
ncbi:MAG: YgdI/YgdR family lipoprotein [Verrucomicrobiales bacterium]|nr:YgdI/YgdR family lipoprotein [Verrucomicrobiales bacterium]